MLMGNTLFDFIDQYINHNSKSTYGDLMKQNKDNKDQKIKQMLSREEYEEYVRIKLSDYQRLLKFS